MNIIKTNADLQQALSAYMLNRKLEIRVNGNIVELNNDTQIYEMIFPDEDAPGEGTLVIDLVQRP